MEFCFLESICLVIDNLKNRKYFLFLFCGSLMEWMCLFYIYFEFFLIFMKINKMFIIKMFLLKFILFIYVYDVVFVGLGRILIIFVFNCFELGFIL